MRVNPADDANQLKLFIRRGLLGNNEAGMTIGAFERSLKCRGFGLADAKVVGQAAVGGHGDHIKARRACLFSLFAGESR